MTVQVSAAEALIDILDREGVDRVFGIPGGPVLPFYDRLADHPRIEHVLVKHEQAAAYAAFAYARISGKLGVCISTLGPGATNLLSGMPVALVSGAPVLAITGQIQSSAIAHGAHQESTGWFRTPNQQAMFAATCKHSVTCNQPQRFPDYVRHSIRIAYASRPGPTNIILPADLLHEQITYRPLDPDRYRLLDHRPVDEQAVRVLAQRISRAKFPILFAGERAMYPDAGRELQELSEALAIPLICDLACKSIVDEHSPMFLGCMGVLGHKAGERYLKQCDLVISVGQTFNEISTLSWDPIYGFDRDLIQIDSEVEEIGKVFPPVAATVGHLPSVIGSLAAELGMASPPHATERRELVGWLRREAPLFDSAEALSEVVPLAPQRVVSEIRDALPPSTIVLSDSSKWTRWLGRYFPASRRTFFTAHDYEPMGWAVAGAIGAHLADVSRPIVCVSGDGAFLMSAIELASAADIQAPIIWIVMNDSRLGVIHDLQRGLYNGRYSATSFKNPDFVQLAAAFGFRGHVIERPDELRTMLSELVELRCGGVLDVRFDPDALPPARPRSLLITKNMGLPNPTPSPFLTKAMLSMLKDK